MQIARIAHHMLFRSFEGFVSELLTENLVLLCYPLEACTGHPGWHVLQNRNEIDTIGPWNGCLGDFLESFRHHLNVWVISRLYWKAISKGKRYASNSTEIEDRKSDLHPLSLG